MDYPPENARSEQTLRLLQQLGAATNTAERQRLRDALIVKNMGVADQIAAGFRNRGIAEEDLRQVAYLALVRAVRRYDESCAGDDFLSYAVPTIKGELRQHFRDHGWVVRPTRRLQELQRAIIQARRDLEPGLGRTPRPRELAAHLDQDEDSVREAMATEGCFQPRSLDEPSHDEGSPPVGHLIRHDESGWEGVEARSVLRLAARELTPRDRRVLFLRFFEGRSQREIGDALGVSQMQASRLIARICTQMRDTIAEPRAQESPVGMAATPVTGLAAASS